LFRITIKRVFMSRKRVLRACIDLLNVSIRFAMLAIVFLFAIAGCGDNYDAGEVGKEDAATFGPQITSANLKQTAISPTMYGEIKNGRNTVFCATFQLAWNSLRNDLLKEDVKVKPGSSIAELLNRIAPEKQDLSENEYVAKAGLIRDGIVERINQDLKIKFPDQSEQIKPAGLGPDDIVAYGFLFKNLKFKNKFETIDNPLKFGMDKTVPVNAFGIIGLRSGKVTKQVSIHNYVSDNDFIIKIKPESDEDEIVLARIIPSRNLEETCNNIQTRIKKGKVERIDDDDALMVPKIKFNIKHTLADLQNRKIINKGFENYRISKASQVIMLKLDEKGAVLKSRVSMYAAAAAPRKQPKHLIFDKPFFVYLNKQGSERPYFAMWVGNAELLEKQ
jgi:hypothetical protein